MIRSIADMKPIKERKRLCFVPVTSISYNLPFTEHGQLVELREALWPHFSDDLIEDFYTQTKIQDMASASQIQKPKKQAENVGLDLGLAVTRALFMNRNTLPERSFNTVFAMFKKIIVTSRTLSVIR